MSIMNKRSSSLVPIKEGDTIIFYINTGGFPLINDAWLQMWQYAKELQPSAADKLDRIKNLDLPDHQVPIAPFNHIYNKKMSNSEKLDKIQNYIDKLQYNHTGVQFFDIRKERPLIGLMEVSKKIIEDSLPIKCLEAVILSIYLINEITGANPTNDTYTGNIEKFTIGFKTASKGNIHRHVVLGVYFNGQFGALGISRRSDLGYKILKYKTLTDLIVEFIECYASYLHKVKRIKIGMPIPNSNRSFESIPWNGCTINPCSMTQSEWSKIVEKQSRAIRHNTYQANLAQTTSLSLKNLTNSNSKSYLLNHLEKQTKFNLKPRSKSQENRNDKPTNSITNLPNNNTMTNNNSESNFNIPILNDLDDDPNDDDYYCAKSGNNASSINLTRLEDLDFLPRTAPLPGMKKSRKNYENLTSFQLITQSSPKNLIQNSNSFTDHLANINTNSGILSKRKKKSLRV